MVWLIQSRVKVVVFLLVLSICFFFVSSFDYTTFVDFNHVTFVDATPDNSSFLFRGGSPVETHGWRFEYPELKKAIEKAAQKKKKSSIATFLLYY